MTSSNLNSLKEYLQRYENLKGQKRKGKDEFVAEFQVNLYFDSSHFKKPI